MLNNVDQCYTLDFMPLKEPDTKLVGTTEASRILGVSKSTLYRMVEQELLHPTKTPGGQRRFNTDELRSYLATSVTIEAPQNPSETKATVEASSPQVDKRNSLNDMTGREWMPATKSFVYQKGLGAKHPHAAIERQHPAPFSYQDIQNLVEFFTKTEMTVLDPFGGVGSTAKASALSGRKCISIELQTKWHELAVERLETEVGQGTAAQHELINADSRQALTEINSESVDFIVTSPPYWSILNKKADHKVKKSRVANSLATNYSESDPADLSNIEDYEQFNKILVEGFILPSARTLKTGKYLALVVSDFRHKSKYVSFHSDLIQGLNDRGIPGGGRLALQGTRILLQNHKSLLPYGYPYAYVENIHHQYVLIFRKTS